MKKWRANSHNKADNRAIKITFARPKKAKRNQKKKKGERKTRISRPIPLLGHLGARVEKFLLCGNHLRSSTRERATRRHPSFFFRRNAHTHFPNTSFTHIYKEWYTYVGRKRRRRVERCWSVLDWGSQATSQPASQPAGRPTNHSTFHSTVLSFPPLWT